MRAPFLSLAVLDSGAFRHLNLARQSTAAAAGELQGLESPMRRPGGLVSARQEASSAAAFAMEAAGAAAFAAAAAAKRAGG